ERILTRRRDQIDLGLWLSSTNAAQLQWSVISVVDLELQGGDPRFVDRDGSNSGRLISSSGQAADREHSLRFVHICADELEGSIEIRIGNVKLEHVNQKRGRGHLHSEPRDRSLLLYLDNRYLFSAEPCPRFDQVGPLAELSVNNSNVR